MVVATALLSYLTVRVVQAPRTDRAFGVSMASRHPKGELRSSTRHLNRYVGPSFAYAYKSRRLQLSRP